jgi:hypothetical protein
LVDAAINELGQAFKLSTAEGFTNITARLGVAGAEAVDFEQELAQSSWAGNVYLSWARRAAQ